MSGIRGCVACLFQLTAARRRLQAASVAEIAPKEFQLTAARRRLLAYQMTHIGYYLVSTHSRSKAAADGYLNLHYSGEFQLTAARRRLRHHAHVRSRHRCFNSQPLEGGCILCSTRATVTASFQLTAARRRLHFWGEKNASFEAFQLTAARRRLLDCEIPFPQSVGAFQLTAARRRLRKPWATCITCSAVSTHSRSKADAHGVAVSGANVRVSTHSRSKAAASSSLHTVRKRAPFQLTAARRRLLTLSVTRPHLRKVSTHSRSKAAAPVSSLPTTARSVSTHSRSKAAAYHIARGILSTPFQLTAARRRLLTLFVLTLPLYIPVSTHSRSKAAAL